MARREISLDGDEWTLGQVMHWQGIDDVTRWIPAKVPGNVRLDLLRAGLIEDPHLAKHNELSRWVDDWNWWFRRPLDAGPAGAPRSFLRFEGIDYHSHIFLNGRKIGEHEGMFAPFLIEVSDIMHRENSLSVCIEYSGQYAKREETLKCQMSFGWDFAPNMKDMGIWDSVSLISTGEIFIRNVHAETIHVAGDYWELKLVLSIDSRIEVRTELEVILEPFNFKGQNFKHSFDLKTPGGVSEHVFNIPVKNPGLWQIREEGDQNLYNLKTAIKRGRAVIDNTSSRIGFRTFSLMPNEDRPRDLWTFTINGKRKFIRGVNWVPADSMPGGVTRNKYEKLLKMACDAHVNLLRVWGGGLREKKDFYDLCDELGILVWQEFPFACPVGKPYPNTSAFKRLVAQEVSGILDTLNNHPSVIMYCGGNEFGASQNRHVVKIVEKLVKEKGGGRPFKPSSPTHGDSHNWRVHHGLANVSEYRNENASFLSEFGMQSVPCRESLNKFIPREYQWPLAPKFPYVITEFSQLRSEDLDLIGRFTPGGAELRNADVWTYHSAQLYKIFRYAEQIGFHDVDSFITATQKMQAHALQVAVEHIRRRRFTASGTIYWQLNEPWPAISWSLIDYYFKPKLAYKKLKHVYSPLLLSLEFPLGPYKPDSRLDARLYIINDLHKEFKNIKAFVRLLDDTDKELSIVEYKIEKVSPDSISELSRPEIRLEGAGPWTIECSATSGSKKISTNEYDLSIVDGKPTFKPLMAADWFFHNILWK